jgi:hypothetical protein
LTENNNLQDYKYFFYGRPSNYALVGAHDRRIWLVVSDENTAHEIRTAFASKISLIVFDLTTFTNNTTELLDNSVCLDWSVPVDEYVNLGIIKTITAPIFTTTYKSLGICSLLNAVPFFNFLSESNQQELQYQMMFYHYLLERVLNQSCDHTSTLFDIDVEQKIKLAFSTELTLSEIELKLSSTANEILASLDLTPYSRARAFGVLTLLGKLYE